MSLELAQLKFAFFATIQQLWGRSLICSIAGLLFPFPIFKAAFWISLLLSSLHLIVESKNRHMILFETGLKLLIFGSIPHNPLFTIWYITLSLSNYLDFSVHRQNSQNAYVSRSLIEHHDVFNFVYTQQVKTAPNLFAYFANCVIEGYILQYFLLMDPRLSIKFIPIAYCFIQVYCMNEWYQHLHDSRPLLPRRDSKLHTL